MAKRVNSREKGKRGEREASQELKRIFPGVQFRRGQQYRGGDDSPDIVGMDGVHLEVKRTEKFQLWKALDQAERDRGADDIAVVLHRRNKSPWVAVVALDDLPNLVRKLGNLTNE